GVATATNGMLYAAGGRNSGGFILGVMEQFDAAANAWTTRAPMPTARWGLGLAGAPNGKVYAIGGWNGATSLATVEEYSPTTNTWTNCGTPAPGNACQLLPTARSYPGAAAAFSGKLYVIGGYVAGPALATVHEYDPAANSWAAQPAMAYARYGLGVAM